MDYFINSFFADFVSLELELGIDFINLFIIGTEVVISSEPSWEFYNDILKSFDF